jgi:hypothetical protein
MSRNSRFGSSNQGKPHMSYPLRTPRDAALIIPGIVIFSFGVPQLLERWQLGLPVMAGGLALWFFGLWNHDQVHRRRGEMPHAVRGQARRR